MNLGLTIAHFSTHIRPKMCSINVFPLRLLMTEVFFRPYLLMAESSALIYQNAEKSLKNPFTH